MAAEDKDAGRDYAAELRDEIETRRRGGGEEGGKPTGGYTEEVFTEWCAELLEENGFIEGFQPSRWEFAPPANSTQMKVDGFHLADASGENEQSAALFVTCWIPEATETLHVPKKRIESLVSVGLAFLQKAIQADPPLHARLEPSDPHSEFARRLWETRSDLHLVTLHVLINGTVGGGQLDGRWLGDIPVKIEIWDARRLVRIHEGRVEEQDEIVVDFAEGLPCVRCPATDGRYEAYLAVMPGVKLAEIYASHGPRILQENVRAFLQLSVSVNKGIRKTLQEEPAAFFAYNNGLSATASAVETTGSQETLSIRRIRGLQIVNGAQTTGSIHRAWRAGETSLDGVHVPLKLTRVNDDVRGEVVARISRYANSQTAVRLDDLSANHPFHVRLEELSRRIWAPGQGTRWYYERTRGQYNDELARQTEKGRFKRENPSGKRFTKTDVAKYVHSWETKPHLVSLGAQKNFIRFSTEWLKDDWLPDDGWYRDLVAKAILFEGVSAAVRRMKLPGYGAQVTAYASAIFTARFGGRTNLKRIWETQDLAPATAAWLQEWSRPVYDAIVSTAQGKNVTEWCKKPGCWEALAAISLPEPPGGLPEIRDSLESGGPAARDTAGPTGPAAGREGLLKLARDIVAHRVIKREDAIGEMQSKLRIGRLSAQKREELEGLFDELAHVAFIDDEETAKTCEGLASLRKLIRSGARDRNRVVAEMAREWLGMKRTGRRAATQIEDLLRTAERRQVVRLSGSVLFCPTPQFDSYEDTFLRETILAIVHRKGRSYARQAITEATVRWLGFTQMRTEMLERVERRIHDLVAEGELECPTAGWIRRVRKDAG